MAKNKKSKKAPEVEEKKNENNNGKETSQRKEARRKNREKKKADKIKKKEEKKSMSEKTEPKVKKKNTTKLIGILVAFGVFALLILGLILLIISRAEPGVDETLSKPVFKDLPKVTNSEKLSIKGKQKDLGKVIVYVDEKEIAKVDVKDDSFVYEYAFDAGEGDYKIEGAGLKTGLIKKRSKKTEAVIVTYDKTPPSTDIELDYPEETDKDKFTLKGNAEENIEVTLRSNGESFSTTTNDKGDFSIEDVSLNEESNSFTLVLIDKAGNEVELTDEFSVVYASTGDLNGPGVSDSTDEVSDTEETPDLPQSAGEFDAAMEFLAQNDLMFVTAILALLAFTLSSGFFVVKYSRES